MLADALRCSTPHIPLNESYAAAVISCWSGDCAYCDGRMDFIPAACYSGTMTTMPQQDFTMLTTHEAAELLNVSRPFVVKLLDAGTLPSRMVGGQRYVLFEDVMAYKRDIDSQRLKTLEELSALDQELGLG